jgi:hypothetical protein
MGTPRLDRLDKNYLINGSFDFFQRSLLSTVIDATLEYKTADRWLVQDIDTFTTKQSERSILSPNAKTKNSFKFTVDPSASTHKLVVAQRIESKFAIDMVSEIISGGLKYFTDGAKQIRVKLSVADVEDDFSAVTEFHNELFVTTDDSAWHDIIFKNITAPATTGRGVQVLFEIDDWTTTAGNNIIYLAQAKVNLGPELQEFSTMGYDYMDELEKCQRYFEKTYDVNTPIGTNTINGYLYGNVYTLGGVGGRISLPIGFKTSKRSLPVVTSYHPVTGTTGQGQGGSGGTITATPINVGESGCTIAGSPDPGGNEYGLRVHWTADAEL